MRASISWIAGSLAALKSRRLPGIAKEYAGALFTATDGKAEPQLAGPAIARAARRLGATILTGCAVRGIETAAGRVVGVVTERSRIACGSGVLAGGALARPVFRKSRDRAAAIECPRLGYADRAAR